MKVFTTLILLGALLAFAYSSCTTGRGCIQGTLIFTLFLFFTPLMKFVLTLTSGSCDRFGNSTACGQVGECDCCAICNSCAQLFAGCSQRQANEDDLYFDPPVGGMVPLWQDLNSTLYSKLWPGNQPNVFRICMRPELPMGVSLTLGSDGFYTLQGNYPPHLLPFFPLIQRIILLRPTFLINK